MDWAMKFLPLQYREQMTDFFGKRGRSWHMSAVIARANVESKCEVECFVHIYNNCTQNNFGCSWTSVHLIPYSDLGVPSQGDTGLRVIKPFSQATQTGSVGRASGTSPRSILARRVDVSSRSRPRQRQKTIWTQASTVLRWTANPCMTTSEENGRERWQGWRSLWMCHQPHHKVWIAAALPEHASVGYCGGLLR